MNEPTQGFRGPATFDATLAILLDSFLPGSATGWPSASRAIENHHLILMQLDRETIDAVASWAASVSKLPLEERFGFLEKQSKDDPSTFEKFQVELYQLYYGSKAVQERISAIAAAGPREMSPFVDHRLVAGVVNEGRGLRRL